MTRTARSTRRPRTTGRRRGALALAGAGTLLLAACGGGTGAGTGTGTGTGTASPTDASPSPTTETSTDTADGGSLTVFAAASLRDVLEPIAEDFAAEHGEADVTFSFAGSSDLVSQIAEGAPADVLVTADERTMTSAVDAGDIDGEPTVVATNTLTIVTPPGNPASVTGLDASLDAATLVVCAPQVPCGAATEKLEEAAGLTLAPASEENSVTDVLGKITSGQGDAGIVYVTDAVGAGDAVERVDIANADDVVNRYPAAVVAESQNSELATDFVEYLPGEDAQAALRDAGFGAP